VKPKSISHRLPIGPVALDLLRSFCDGRKNAGESGTPRRSFICKISQAGTQGSSGRIIYAVLVHFPPLEFEHFIEQILNKFGQLLNPFYESDTIDKLCGKLATNLSERDIQLISSRWSFFKLMRSVVLPDCYVGFTPINVVETAVQVLYNLMKGGLDSNMQQYNSITPSIHTGFEQKYVICLLFCIVTNAWRAQQLLHATIDEDQQFSMMAHRKLLGSTTQTLKDFHYILAAALINSANDIYFQNVLIAEPKRACGRHAKAQNLNAALGFDRQPDTLAERLLQEQWPKQHWYRSFRNQNNLLELRFTHNDKFNHELRKDRKVDSCTALFV
jgi:hypothetical protein